MADKKDKLRDVLKQAVRDKGISITDLARTVNVDLMVMQNWLKRNRFLRSKIEEVATAAGLATTSPESLEQAFLVGWIDVARSAARLGKGLKQRPTKYDEVNLMPLVQSLAETSLKTITFSDLQFLLDLQDKFESILGAQFLEEALKKRKL